MPRERQSRSRKSTATKAATEAATRTPGSGEPAASTPASSATDPAGLLGLERDDWTPPEQPTPADANLDDVYVPVTAEPIDWTPERAGALVRAGGFLLHTSDGMSREPGGEELWRATEQDVEAIAPPLSRILNRYEPARRLAGVSDETEFALGVVGYVRRNLADRGRVVTEKRQRDEPTIEAEGAWGPHPE